MLVDDHPLVRSAVRQAISDGDVELVAEAASAEDAFALALSIRPDILLLDINLPGMKGLQMLEEIAPRLPDTKIVMLTVSDTERDVIDAIVPRCRRLPDQGPQPGSAAADAQGPPSRRARHVTPVGRHRDAPLRGGSAPWPSVRRRRRSAADPQPARERRAAHARRRPHRPRDRRGADHLAAHGRDARQQHPAQALGAQPRRGRAALPHGAGSKPRCGGSPAPRAESAIRRELPPCSGG